MWIRATLTATDPEGLTASVEGVFLTKWGPPKVKSVSVVPDAGNDDTYALGDVIRVAVRFDDPVSVDTSGGVPRLTRTTCPRSLQVEPCRDRGLSLHPFEEVPHSKKEFLISSHTLTAVSERELPVRNGDHRAVPPRHLAARGPSLPSSRRLPLHAKHHRAPTPIRSCHAGDIRPRFEG